jgi:N-acetyl-alpha-D-muramate 1-phosphate uridylyltransferase
MSGNRITHAMVLAAGFGQRMRPLTNTLPKPLIRLGGRALIDHVLDRLAGVGVQQVIVNVHYLPHLIETHLRTRTYPQISISDERELLLDTGGAVQKAMPLLGDAPFFVHNSDSVWIERSGNVLARMVDTWNPVTMDALLLLAPVASCLGYDGHGDFDMNDHGIVLPRPEGQREMPYVFAGVSINHPRLFEGSPEGPFSIVRHWNKALAAGRLAGMGHDGVWMHVGTPEALADAERCLSGRAA